MSRSLMGLNVIHRNFQLLLLKLTLEDILKSNFMTHSKCRVAELGLPHKSAQFYHALRVINFELILYNNSLYIIRNFSPCHFGEV
jgi:hypothetical protein